MFLVCFELLGDRAGFPVPHRHLRTSAGLEDVLDESCCGDAEDELAPDVAFDHWPTHMNNRVLRSRVCPMTGRQACHRVFAPSRRDQGRERALVLPRFFAPSRPTPPSLESWRNRPRILAPLAFFGEGAGITHATYLCPYF